MWIIVGRQPGRLPNPWKRVNEEAGKSTNSSFLCCHKLFACATHKEQYMVFNKLLSLCLVDFVPRVLGIMSFLQFYEFLPRPLVGLFI